MKKASLPVMADEDGDYCDDFMIFSIEECVACGPFVPAKILETCRDQGLAYVCLIIPGANFNVMIEVEGHRLRKEYLAIARAGRLQTT